MKQAIVIAVTVYCLVIWLAGGCGRPASQNEGKTVIDQNNNKIPPEIAGTWEERDGIWRITIEPNGVVSSARIPLMQAIIRPNQTTYAEMKDGNFSSFTAGNCIAEFKPETMELFVYIEIKNFLIRFFEIRTGGSQIDTFTGPVSENGRVWQTEHVNVFDYGPDFPQDVNTIMPDASIFDKVE